jgi:GNAT superfamily N-acetyltransferase
MAEALEMETSTSRRRIRPLCREVLEAKCHGGKGYTGAWLMREEKYTKIVVMTVVRHEGKAIGWCWVTNRGLLGTWVEANWRRQGLGRRMVERVLVAYPAAWRAARERCGIHYVGGTGEIEMVRAAAHKPDGVAFYEALGAVSGGSGGEWLMQAAS